MQPFDPDGDASDTRTLPASLVAACNVLRDLRESLMEEVRTVVCDTIIVC